jgi:hypothetical protein
MNSPFDSGYCYRLGEQADALWVRTDQSLVIVTVLAASRLRIVRRNDLVWRTDCLTNICHIMWPS